MTAAAPGRAATLRERGVGRQVFQPEQFDRLIDAALADQDHEVGTQRVVYAEDATVPRPPGQSGRSVLVVTVNRGWGGAYYRNPEGWAWITRNRQQSSDVPELLYDPEAGVSYPTGAAIPVDQLRKALEEYLRTGDQPSCVEWQEAERYMIY